MQKRDLILKTSEAIFKMHCRCIIEKSFDENVLDLTSFSQEFFTWFFSSDIFSSGLYFL